MNDKIYEIHETVQAGRAPAAAELTDMAWGHTAVRDFAGRGAWMKVAGCGFEEIDDDRVRLGDRAGDVQHGSGKRRTGVPEVWSDHARAAFERDRVRSPAQREAGWNHLERLAERNPR